MLSQLYNIAIRLIEMIDVVWDWLQSDLSINLKFWIIDFNHTFSWSPLDLLGSSIIIWLAFIFIKNLIPTA